METYSKKEIESGSGYASDGLREKLLSKLKAKEGIAVNFAYTDYGGDFFDKVCCEYFFSEYPDNTLSETTSWSGQNCWIFGEVAIRFLKETNEYLVGFENLEDCYYELEGEMFTEFVDEFIEDIKDNYKFNVEQVCEYIYEQKFGYYSVFPNGVDYCETSLIEELKQHDLISDID